MPASKLRTSATSKAVRTDLLARAYLDILAREEGVHAKSLLHSGDPFDPVEILLDDLMDTPIEERVSVRPDLAAVAVLTARAIEAEPGLTRTLRRRNAGGHHRHPFVRPCVIGKQDYRGLRAAQGPFGRDQWT